MYCPECGTEITSEKIPAFCIHCGCRFSDYENSPDRLMLYDLVPEEPEPYQPPRKNKPKFLQAAIIILILCVLITPIINIFYGNNGDSSIAESVEASQTASAYKALIENGGDVTADIIAEMELRDAVNIALTAVKADVISAETEDGEVYVYLRGKDMMNIIITLDEMRYEGMLFLELMQKHEDVKEIFYYVYMEFEIADGEYEVSPVMAYAISGDTMRDADFTYAYSDDIEYYVDDYWHNEVFDYMY